MAAMAIPTKPIEYFRFWPVMARPMKYSIGLIGIAIAAILHGLNDWNPVNGHVAWVLVTLISVILFLGYARAGAWLPQQALASSDRKSVV